MKRALKIDTAMVHIFLVAGFIGFNAYATDKSEVAAAKSCEEIIFDPNAMSLPALDPQQRAAHERIVDRLKRLSSTPPHEERKARADDTADFIQVRRSSTYGEIHEFERFEYDEALFV